MAIVTLGNGLAKNVFALHGVDATGRVALQRPSVPRAEAPARVFDQGPQHRTAASMTVCSFAVRNLAR
jgi:hypothetical protein